MKKKQENTIFFKDIHKLISSYHMFPNGNIGKKQVK